MAKSLINYLTYKTKSGSCSVEAQFQNQAGSILMSLLPIKAARTSFMHLCNQSPRRVTMMLSQTWFATDVSAIWNHSLWHNISIMVLWQPSCGIHVRSPLLLHCSLIMHINIPFKIYFKVSANCR
jgi:hypothetical protein